MAMNGATAATLQLGITVEKEAVAPGELRKQHTDQLPAVADLLRREQIFRRLLALADGVALSGAVIAAALLWRTEFTWFALAVPVFAILVAKIQGLYDRDDMVLRKSSLAEWRRLLQDAALASIGVYLSWRILTTANHEAGMRLFAFLTLATCGVTILGRAAARRLARYLSPPERCVIIGDLDKCAALATAVSAINGVELIGGISSTQLGDGSLDDLRQTAAQFGFQRVIIAPSADTPEAQTLELIRNAKWIGIRVSLFPTVLAAVGGCAVFDELDGHMLLGIPRFGLSNSSEAIKRTFDLFGATVALTLLSPLMLVIALLIRRDSDGPALFRQTRVGRDGRRFQMLKFRSMVDGADEMKRDLLDRNEASLGLFKIADDPRITRIGGRLRRSHLDELPQLINVLRGEMSLVGPRPLIEEEDALFAGGDRSRLCLTPGITGPWQIRGPMSTPLSEMAKLDYLYISQWSLWQDIDLLIRTGFKVLDRGGH
jgi:exopolysaccharide biosynthesis polyprenyl glycosylphosphotransferase